MAATIKGITVEIGGNTLGLQKALADVNSKSRSLQSELKQVEKLLKLDPSNTELLAQKQKLLGEAVNTTSEKLNSLKEAEQQVQNQFKEGKISEEHYRALQREIVKTEQDLNGYEGQLREISSESKKAGDATEDIGKKAIGTAPSMKSFSTGAVLAITAISVAAVAAAKAAVDVGKKLYQITYDAGSAADDIVTMSKQFRVSTGDLQKFAYAAEFVDVPLETFGSSLGKLTKAMGKASDGSKEQIKAFEKLGVTFKNDVTGKLRDSEDVFYDIIDALGSMEDETQADIYANALFGRSFQDLNPLVAEGSGRLKELGKEAETLGLVLSDEQLAKLNNYKDTIDKLQAQVKIAALPFIESLIPAFEKVAGVISEKLADPKVQETLTSIGQKIGEFALKITDKLIEFLNSDSFANLADDLLTLGGSIGDALIYFVEYILPSLVDGLTWMVENKDAIANVMLVLGAALTALGIATGNIQVALAGIALVGGGVIGIMGQLNEYLAEHEETIKNWSESNQLYVGEAQGYWDNYFAGISNNFLSNMSWLENDAPESLRVWAEENGFYTDEATAWWDDFKINILRNQFETNEGIATAWNNIKVNLESAWIQIKTVFLNAWNGIKDNFLTPLKNAFMSIPASFKEAFTFELPHIKLPHFKIIGKFSLDPPSIPTIGVDWYAKGGIFNSPSIIGVGEKGSEVVLPIDRLSGILADVLQKMNVHKNVVVNVYPRELSASQTDYLIYKVNRTLGGMVR